MFGPKLGRANRGRSENSISLHTNPRPSRQVLLCRSQHEPHLIAGIAVNPSTQERRMLFAAADIGLTNQCCANRRVSGGLLQYKKALADGNDMPLYAPHPGSRSS